ncbi:hypothetical protein [Christiangramia sabulilitoris]|uniref:Uncharacterized protein n=1 Tax=Christiangramia sabulilitoris TaxID=2583991 RepID=A0A550HZ94_9FLAO|nr:hypothetical protein [Christiangramia sabulilitoris]TRO64020.1 hypothetical protein FGM01_10955 [Christiangramia sabulilitoris]
MHKKKPHLFDEAFRAGDRVPFDLAQDRLLTLDYLFHKISYIKKKPHLFDEAFRAGDRVPFDPAQDRLLTLYYLFHKISCIKKSLIFSTKLLERETGFPSTLHRTGFSPWIIFFTKFHT